MKKASKINAEELNDKVSHNSFLVGASPRPLGEFKYCCDHWLKKLAPEQLAEAVTYFNKTIKGLRA